MGLENCRDKKRMVWWQGKNITISYIVLITHINESLLDKVQQIQWKRNLYIYIYIYIYILI